MSQSYDYIILGAGAAGLSLIHYLNLAGVTNKKILVIDKDQKKTNDRTWCFWADHPLDYQCAQAMKWPEITFLTPDFEKTASIQPYQYYHIRGLDFYNELMAEVDSSPNVTFQLGSVQSMSSDADVATVITDKGSFTGQYIFTSIVTEQPDPAKSIQLLQHFYGWELKTKSPVFKGKTVHLMDFRTENVGLSDFVYILPFSDTHALVEYTCFSAKIFEHTTYRHKLKTYVEHELKLTDYTILETETARIPMTNHSYPFAQTSRIFNIGTAGGATKPTTGYTFMTIQRHMQQLAGDLKVGRPPSPFRRGPARYQFYDDVLLRIIRDHPAQIRPIMTTLFKRNAFSDILRFLDEQSTFLQELRLLLSLPWMPFLNSTIYHFLRK